MRCTRYVKTRAPKNTPPGVDNFLIRDDKDKLDLANSLLSLESYQASPVRSVYISKANGKKRPLGIPTLRDRAIQNLFKLVIEPITESFSDPNSYGFRPNRSAHQALAVVSAFLKSRFESEKLSIFDADIQGFFDNISHDWILDNFPISLKYKHVLRS